MALADKERRRDVSDITLEGFVGADPEKRVAGGSGNVWTTFGVARNFFRKDNGQREPNPGETVENGYARWTQWFDITAFGDHALHALRDVHRGSRVQIKGRLETRNFADRESGQKRFSLGVIADEIVVIEYEKATRVSSEPEKLPF